MVVSVLPVYLTLVLGLTPVQYGLVDGLYQGVTAAVRIVGGLVADLTRRPRRSPSLGYALSCVCKLVFLPARGFAAITGLVAVDRVGKGLRTAPRDAMIATASEPASLGRAFGVHRAMDTAGALAGPLLAFGVLAWLVDGYDVVFVLSFGAGRGRRRGPGALRARPTGPPGPCPRRAWPLRRPQPPSARAAGPPRRRAPWSGDRRTGACSSSARCCPAARSATASSTSCCATGWASTRRSSPCCSSARPRSTCCSRCRSAGSPTGSAGSGSSSAGTSSRRSATSAAGCCRPGRGLVAAVLALLGAYYAATDGVLPALTAPLVPERVRASGIAGVQTVMAVGAHGVGRGLRPGLVALERSRPRSATFTLVLLAGIARRGRAAVRADAPDDDRCGRDPAGLVRGPRPRPRGRGRLTGVYAVRAVRRPAAPAGADRGDRPRPRARPRAPCSTHRTSCSAAPPPARPTAGSPRSRWPTRPVPARSRRRRATASTPPRPRDLPGGPARRA